MFSVYPTSSFDTPRNPRDRYLAAIAEARAAEAEYMAYAEELALLSRLQELQSKRLESAHYGWNAPLYPPQVRYAFPYGQSLEKHIGLLRAGLQAEGEARRQRLEARRMRQERQQAAARAAALVAQRQAILGRHLSDKPYTRIKPSVRHSPELVSGEGKRLYPGGRVVYVITSEDGTYPGVPKSTANQDKKSALWTVPSADGPAASKQVPVTSSDTETSRTQLESGAKGKTSNSKPEGAPSATASGEKGKMKESSTATSSMSSTYQDVVKAFSEVRTVDDAFEKLEEEFSFPSYLDFLAEPSSKESSATAHLAFTVRNHPVRVYSHALAAFLARLDNIDSYGSDTLRRKRKDVVAKVEGALEELEKEVEMRWKNAEMAKVKVAVIDEVNEISNGDVIVESLVTAPDPSDRRPPTVDDDARNAVPHELSLPLEDEESPSPQSHDDSEAPSLAAPVSTASSEASEHLQPNAEPITSEPNLPLIMTEQPPRVELDGEEAPGTVDPAETPSVKERRRSVTVEDVPDDEWWTVEPERS